MGRTETTFKVAGYDVTVVGTTDAKNETTCELHILGHGLEPTNIIYRINTVLEANNYYTSHKWDSGARILTYKNTGHIKNGRLLNAVTTEAIGDAIKSIQSTVSLSDLRFEQTEVLADNRKDIAAYYVRSYLQGADENKVDELLRELNQGLTAKGSNKQFKSVWSTSKECYVLQEIHEYSSDELPSAQESAEWCTKNINTNLETGRVAPSAAAAFNMEETRKHLGPLRDIK